MTKDEAINTLANFKVYISGGGVTDKKANEALDFAIVTLVNLPSAQPKENCWVHIDDIYRLISGHSNYHGDSILAALTCLAEGKEVPNHITVLDAQLERDIPLDYIIDEGGNAICPKCGANVEWHKYCGECGQALKWEESNE